MKKSIIATLLLFSVDSFAWDYPSTCQSYVNKSNPVIITSNYNSAMGNCTSLVETEYQCFSCSEGIGICQRRIDTLDTRCNKTIYIGYLTSSSECPSGTSKDSGNMCMPIVLSSFNNNPSGCSKAGGTFMSIGTEQVGGTSYGASFFGGQGIVLGGDLRAITKCATTAEAVGDVIIQATGLIPLASTFIKSQLLKRLTNKNWIALLDKFMKPDGGYDFTSIGGKPQNFPDTHVDLPKLPSPSQVQSGPSTAAVREMFDRGISESPVPTVSTPDGAFPSRAPNITVAPEYQNLPDAIIPVNPTTNEPYLDYSVVDGANSIIKSTPSASPSAPQPKLSDVVPSTGTTQKPVKETFDLSSFMPDDYSPRPIIATVPQTTTKSVIYSGSDPIDKFVTDISYPDSSSSRQTVTVNPQTGRGDISITTLSPEGVSNTTTKPFQTTNYPSTGVTSPSIPSDVTISPYPPTISNPDGTSSPTSPSIDQGVTNTSPTTNPDTVSNQTADSIINATMPSYSFPETGEFETFDKSLVSRMISDATDTINNVKTQYDAAKTIYDQTLNLVENGWEPPQISPGQCGNSLTLNWHGKQIDLCPPITQNLTIISPVISLLVTIAGGIVAVGIFIAGF